MKSKLTFLFFSILAIAFGLTACSDTVAKPTAGTQPSAE